MQTKIVPIESTGLAFDAGALICAMQLMEHINRVNTLEEASLVVASAIREMNKPVLEASAEFLTAKGYKVGEYELGIQRQPDGSVGILLTPETAPVVGSDVENPDAKLILPEIAEGLVSVDGESPLV